MKDAKVNVMGMRALIHCDKAAKYDMVPETLKAAHALLENVWECLYVFIIVVLYCTLFC